MIRFPPTSNRPRIWAALGLLVLAAGCGESAPTRPSVLLVTLDTTRADRMGAYGHPGAATPAFDSLARNGVLFERAWSVTPLTTPAHASMLTGLLPTAHGVRNNGRFRLPAEAHTLAETLSAAGWVTGAFVAAFPVARMFGFDQGFATFDDDFGVDASGRRRSERTCEEVVALAAPWLRDRMANGDAPFFAWVHFYDAHDPYTPPQPFAGEFRGREYDGEIAYADRCLGELLGELERGRALGRTVVVVAGDHGEALGEHGEPTHGLFVYEEVLRVPLVVSAPWTVPRGERRHDLASLVDVAPTVLALAGVAAPGEVHGRALFGAATGTSPSDTREVGPGRAVYAESFFGNEEFGWAPLVAVRRGDAKWIAAPRPERYDLAADPTERTNLAGRDPDRDAGMESLLAEVAGWASSGSLAPAEGGMSEEALERLQSLGYVGGGAGERPRAAEVAGRDPKDAVADYRAYRQGTDLLASGRGGDALPIFVRLSAGDPDNAEFRLRLGMAYASVGRLQDAEATFRSLLDRYPDFYLGNRRLSGILESQGRWQESLDLWLALRERGVSYVGMGTRLARAWLGVGRPDRALEEARRAQEAEGPSSELLVLEGRALEGLGLPDEALRRYQEAAAAFPSDPAPRAAAARILRSRRGAPGGSRLAIPGTGP